MKYTRELLIEKSKIQTKANRGLSWSWPFHIILNRNKANRGLSWSWPFHIILNRKVEPVNHRYVEQAFCN